VITTTTKVAAEKTKAYPYLGICQDNGSIVLFTAPDTGMLLHKGCSAWPVGEYEDDGWREEDFEVFQGSLTMENSR
jgi:hypothetical protein